MKNRILIAVIALLLSVPVLCQAQSVINTNSALYQIYENFLTASNHTVLGYGIYDTKSKTGGGGIADLYNFNGTFGTMARLDVIGHSVSRVAGTLTLQVPVQVSSNVQLVPIIDAGIATTMSGAGSANGSATSIAGVGLAVKAYSRLYIGANYELWGDHPQIRAGASWQL